MCRNVRHWKCYGPVPVKVQFRTRLCGPGSWGKRIGNRAAEFTSGLYLPRYGGYANRTPKQCAECTTRLIWTQTYAAAVANTGSLWQQQYQTVHTESDHYGEFLAAVLTLSKEFFWTDRLPTFPQPWWFHQGLPAILFTRTLMTVITR
jgi:hypothetical protein